MKKFIRSTVDFSLPTAFPSDADMLEGFDIVLLKDMIKNYLPEAKEIVLSNERKLETPRHKAESGMTWIPFVAGLDKLNDKFLMHMFVIFEHADGTAMDRDQFREFLAAFNRHFQNHHYSGSYFMDFGQEQGGGARETALYLRVYINEEWPCKEHPELLVGQPLGQYHCGVCGQMQVAGLPHLPNENVEVEGM